MSDKVMCDLMDGFMRMNWHSTNAKYKDAVRSAFIDYISVVFPSIMEPNTKRVFDYLACAPDGTVKVPGMTKPLSERDAAFAWGVMGHSLDYDDVSLILIGHPSSVLIPVCMSLGYKHRSTGYDVLEAFSCGYEAIIYFSKLSAAEQYRRGWHTTSSLGILGATVCAARLLRLPVNQAINAISMAASMASGLQINFGTDTKAIHAGCAASNALTAVELAKNGVTGASNAFTGPSSYLSVFSEDESLPPYEGCSDIQSDLVFKKYPACGFLARPIECALSLHDRFHGKMENIKSINCHISTQANNVLGFTTPRNGNEAKFSLEYCVAEALEHGEIKLAQFKNEYVKTQSNNKTLREKINRKILDSNGKKIGYADEFCKIEVITNDGDTCTEQCSVPTGFPGRPFSLSDQRAKFDDCTLQTTKNTSRGDIFSRLVDLETENDMSRLVDLLATMTL